MHEASKLLDISWTLHQVVLAQACYFAALMLDTEVTRHDQHSSWYRAVTLLGQAARKACLRSITGFWKYEYLGHKPSLSTTYNTQKVGGQGS